MKKGVMVDKNDEPEAAAPDKNGSQMDEAQDNVAHGGEAQAAEAQVDEATPGEAHDLKTGVREAQADEEHVREAQAE